MDVDSVLVEALGLVLWVGAPALGACLVAGMLTGLLQGAAHAGDAGVSFVPRWLAVLAALFLSRAFLETQVVDFAARMFREMARLS